MRAFAKKARNSFDPLRPYRPYLLRIGKNLMIDEFRKQKASVGIVDIDDILDKNLPLATCDNRADILHWQRLSSATSDLLNTLGPFLQQIVQLRFSDGVSQDAAGNKLGVSRKKVRNGEAQVRLLLVQHLKSCGLWDCDDD